MDTATPDNTTYGQDIDAFVEKHFAPEDRKLAMLQMNRIAIKAMRSTIEELSNNLLK